MPRSSRYVLRRRAPTPTTPGPDQTSLLAQLEATLPADFLTRLAVPAVPAVAGDCAQEESRVRRVVTELLAGAEGGRAGVAARMSTLLGTPVSAHQLNAMTANSRPHRFPAGWLVPLALATGHEPAQALAPLLAGTGLLVVGPEVVALARVGWWAVHEASVQQQRRQALADPALAGLRAGARLGARTGGRSA